MPSHLKLLHIWQRQLEAILVGYRVTRVRGLALLVVGLLLAGTVRLPSVASVLPCRASDESRIRRLRRWLANDQVVVADLWPPIRRTLVRDVVGRDLMLVFDPTPQAGHTTILVLGMLLHKLGSCRWRGGSCHSRITGIKRCRSSLGRWPQRWPPICPQAATSRFWRIGASLDPRTIRVLRAVGWHIVFRVNAGPKQSNRVRVDGMEYGLWEWITAQAFTWSGPVDLFKDAGWMRLELTVVWDRRYGEPWILVSDEPAGSARVRAYRRRTTIEATFADTKRRGYDLERTKVIARARIDRLVLALVIALWWVTQLGLRVIRTGIRSAYDRSDRRDRSVIHLGAREVQERLIFNRCPALPFSQRNGTWRYALYS